MHAVVVFESMFGNTESIAEAVGKGLATHAEVDVVNVDDAPSDWAGIDLLVVGGPTHAHGMSRPVTRKDALRDSDGGVRSATGVREWLGSLRPAPKQVPVAVFDTRVDKPRWLVGSAALGAQKLLQRCGGLPLVPPTSFFVDITKEATVLSEGEQERAEAWGADLGTMLVAEGGS